MWNAGSEMTSNSIKGLVAHEDVRPNTKYTPPIPSTHTQIPNTHSLMPNTHLWIPTAWVGCTSKQGDVRPRSQSASGLSQTRAYLAYQWGDTLLYYTLSWIPLCKTFFTEFYVAYQWDTRPYTIPCHTYSTTLPLCKRFPIQYYL